MEIISRKEAKERGLKRYFTGKPCKHGHITERFSGNGECYGCYAVRAASEHNKKKRKQYRENNKEAISESKKKCYYAKHNQYKAKLREYRDANLARERNRVADWVAKNKERKLQMDRNYYANNKDKWAEYERKNPLYRFTRRTLYRLEIYSNASKYERLIGYSQKEFIEHIESQFKEGMCWENRSEWHIDHIKPIKAFLDEGITDPKIINALDNLQPLWAHENLSKGAKYDG